MARSARAVTSVGAVSVLWGSSSRTRGGPAGRQMSWLPWLGVRCVAVLERPAGGGAGGEDEVRPVHSPPGDAVDEDRFGLGPGLGVHEHHAALTGGQARVAPCGQDDEYGPEGTAEFCQQVLVAGRVCLVLAPFEQAGADHALEPAGQ